TGENTRHQPSSTRVSGRCEQGVKGAATPARSLLLWGLWLSFAFPKGEFNRVYSHWSFDRALELERFAALGECPSFLRGEGPGVSPKVHVPSRRQFQRFPILGPFGFELGGATGWRL